MGFSTILWAISSGLINVFLGTLKKERFIFTRIKFFIWILIVCLFEKQVIFQN